LTKKEAFGLTLVGALVVFAVTTVIVGTGLALTLGEDEGVLFFLQVVSVLVAIGSGLGLAIT
jgi:hypothetical protein